MWGLVRADGTVLYDEEFKADRCPTAALSNRFYVPTADGSWQLYATESTPQVVGSGRYASVSLFSQGAAVVTPESGKVTIINREGEVVKTLDKVNSKEIKGCQTFDSEGYAIFAVAKGDETLFGLLNHKGKVLIEPIYCMLSGSKGHYFAIDKAQRKEFDAKDYDNILVHVINAKGKELYSFKAGKYANCYFVGDGLLAYVKEEKGAGLLDAKGNELLKNKKHVELITEVRKGAVIFSDGEGYGLMDLDGNVLIRPKFEHLAFASDRLLWGYMKRGDEHSHQLFNLQGHKVSDEEYPDVYPFYNDDVAFVRFNAKEIGLCDTNGKDYSADVFIHNLVPYNASELIWIEPDLLDIDQLLDGVSIDKNQLGAFRLNMTASEMVSAYKRNSTAAPDPNPENYCFQSQLSYNGTLDDVYYDVTVTASQSLADYTVEWRDWDPVRNYNWTPARVDDIKLTLTGGKVAARSRKVYEALVGKLKQWGKVREKGTCGTSIDLGDGHGYVVTFDDYSVTLRLYNNDNFKYIDLSAPNAENAASVDSTAVF